MPGGNGLLKHTLERPEGLVECSSVLDIGAGIRPFSWYAPKIHLCIEPYEPYCAKLSSAGYSVFRGTAEHALAGLKLKAEGVLMLDVLEHMEKDVGRRVVALAKVAATRQVVVFTPCGFVAQEGDVWGLGGDEWQRHRSGWTPEDFPGWTVLVQESGRGFFALWDKAK
jgi:hypothetical protein